MSNINTITSKKIQICIKKGYSPETLAEKYNCTIEELKERIGQLYHAGNGARAAEIFSALEGNRRKPQRHLLKKSEASEQNQVSEPILEEHSEEPTEKSLSTLMEEEEHLSREIMSIESNHKALSGQHRNCAKTLRSLQEQLKEMLETVRGISGTIDQTESDADQIAEKMNGLSTLRREKLVALEKVRQEIEERSTVTICVTNDGTIEAVNAEGYTLSDEGYQDLKAELTDRDECLDLRMREIVTLAKLLKMTQTIERIVLICDNPELEKAFWAIRQ